MKIAYKITAVRNRERLVYDLLKDLDEPESIVYWDEERRGCIWNTQRAWADYKKLPADVTHLCVMSDDVDIVHNFKDLSDICINRFPDAIWSFYSNEIPFKKKGAYTPYVKLTQYNIRGISFVMPVGLIQGYIDFYENNMKKYNYARDDATCRMYACLNQIPVMTTLPNLVRAKDVPSEFPNYGKTRNSDSWQGYDINRNQFLTNDFVEVSKSLKGATETHLRPDNEMDIIIRKEMKRQLEFKKAMEGYNGSSR